MCVMLIRFPKCQTHMYTRFENGCGENSTQILITKYSTQEKNKHVICRPRSVRIGKNCALGLEYGSRPLAQFFPIPTSWPANNIYVCDIININFSRYGATIPGKQRFQCLPWGADLFASHDSKPR